MKLEIQHILFGGVGRIGPGIFANAGFQCQFTSTSLIPINVWFIWLAFKHVSVETGHALSLLTNATELIGTPSYYYQRHS